MPHKTYAAVKGCYGVSPEYVNLLTHYLTTLKWTLRNVIGRRSTQNGNLSNTALQQAQVAAALTQGRINAAVAQVLAYQAVEQANRMQQAEIDRLERLAEWRDARLRTNAMADAMRAAALQNRDRLREGLLFKIPSFYMGGQA